MILEKDTEPGILLKARKPLNYKPNDLNSISLYSMAEGKRITYIPEKLTTIRKILILAKGFIIKMGRLILTKLGI